MKKIKALFIMALAFMPFALLAQVTTSNNVAPNPAVNLNAASGTSTYMVRPAGHTDCSIALANTYRIGDGSGRVELCVTDLTNLNANCGGGNNKEDRIYVYTDQDGNGAPDAVYGWFNNSGFEINALGPAFIDCQDCVMSPSGSGYIWLYFCPESGCSAGDKLVNGVTISWNSFPTSANDPITTAEPIDTCTATFSANNYDATATHNGCGYNAPPCFQNDLDNNTGTALSPNGAPTSNNGGDVGYSVENDIWFTFNPGLVGTWNLTFTPRSCYASNGISSGGDACDFYANGFQYALFEGTSSTNFTTLVSGGTNGQNLTAAQAIPINVTTTTTTYYLQIEGYAGTGCQFDAVLTPPGAVCTLLPLPIQLLEFNAEMTEEKKVDLSWSTATEVNNDYFTIERSKDGSVFEVVGIVDGAGNSIMVKNYEMSDDNPHSGTSYYRLKQTDYDGDYTFSQLVAVNNNSGIADIKVYPNPTRGDANLIFDAEYSSSIGIKVLDIAGRVVYQTNYIAVEGNNVVNMTISGLGQGMYFVVVGDEVNTDVIKFIKD